MSGDKTYMTFVGHITENLRILLILREKTISKKQKMSSMKYRTHFSQLIIKLSKLLDLLHLQTAYFFLINLAALKGNHTYLLLNWALREFFEHWKYSFLFPSFQESSNNRIQEMFCTILKCTPYFAKTQCFVLPFRAILQML